MIKHTQQDLERLRRRQDVLTRRLHEAQQRDPKPAPLHSTPKTEGGTRDGR